MQTWRHFSQLFIYRAKRCSTGLLKSNILPLRDLSDQTFKLMLPLTTTSHGNEIYTKYTTWYMQHAHVKTFFTISSYTVSNDVVQVCLKAIFCHCVTLVTKCSSWCGHWLQRATPTKIIENILHGICNMHTWRHFYHLFIHRVKRCTTGLLKSNILPLRDLSDQMFKLMLPLTTTSHGNEIYTKYTTWYMQHAHVKTFLPSLHTPCQTMYYRFA